MSEWRQKGKVAEEGEMKPFWEGGRNTARVTLSTLLAAEGFLFKDKGGALDRRDGRGLWTAHKRSGGGASFLKLLAACFRGARGKLSCGHNGRWGRFGRTDKGDSGILEVVVIGRKARHIGGGELSFQDSRVKF